MNRAIQFAQFFPDSAIVSTLSTQLSWSHFVELLPIKDPLARDFYAPPLPLLRARLHEAIEHAREQAARRLPNLEEPR